jgi:16S rRNA (guanine527-N7)-methyltransferase
LFQEVPQAVALVPILERAQRLGFLGREPVENHIAHALRYRVPAVGQSAKAMDIGSGGGVPGLVLAVLLPHIQWTFLDAMAKRCQFLRESIVELDLSDRVEVVEGRAEELGRLPQFRLQFDVVTARSFGAPAVLAECASPFLRVGGHVVVSEPPTNEDRWPSAGLAQLGLTRLPYEDPSVAILFHDRACDERFPRRTGVPAKRPIF